MKKLILQVLLLIPLLFTGSVLNHPTVTTYYVSAGGDDTHAGTVLSPWKTTTKVNAAVLASGDIIKFNRGDVFYGALVTQRDNISYQNYGNTALAKPVISGFTIVTGMTSVGGGIYKKNIPNAKSNLIMVTVNGSAQQIGRYPNSDAANGGYLSYESYSTNTSITDTSLAASPVWTGAEVVIRKSESIADRCHITNHSGTTITYTINGAINPITAVASTGKTNFGYFIQNDIRTLDKFGEWYLNPTTKDFNMYFGAALPTSYTIKVATIDTLLNIAAHTNITVDGLAFEGANMSGIFSNDGDFLTVANCDFSNMGAKAIHFWNTGDVNINHDNFNTCLNNSIQVANSSAANPKDNVYIGYDTVVRTAPFIGMGSYGGDFSDNKAIRASVRSNLVVENTSVSDVGYNGIDFQGNNVTIQDNEVSYFCKTTEDGAGIYTFAGYNLVGGVGTPSVTYTNRIVRNNIVHDGVGAPIGTSSPTSPSAQGFYGDGMTMNVAYSNNTGYNLSDKAFTFNNPVGISVKNNVIYNAQIGVSITRWSWGTVSRDTITGNQFFPLNNTQTAILYSNTGLNNPSATDIGTALRQIGVIDYNYYSTYNPLQFKFLVYITSGGALIQMSPVNLTNWTIMSGYDVHSTITKNIPEFTVSGLVGSNLASGGGTFTSSVIGYNVVGANTTQTWDGTSKITSAGSSRLNFSAPVANKYSYIHSPIGAISSIKKYVLRYHTLGTTTHGITGAYIRKTASPYTTYTPIGLRTFDANITEHEYLFSPLVTDVGGSLVIEVEQTSGTPYIDDVQFYEATGNYVNVEDSIRFLVNHTNAPITINLNSNFIDILNNVMSAVTLPPFSSKILYYVSPLNVVVVKLRARLKT